MLSSILPGLRDIRTPLATGYLYLLVCWLAFGETRLVPNASRPFAVHVDQLTRLLGPGTLLVALSFVAYLVGSLWSSRSIGPAERENQGFMKKWFLRYPYLALTFPISLTRYLQHRFSKRSELLEAWVTGVAQALTRSQPDPEIFLEDTRLPSEFVALLHNQIEMSTSPTNVEKALEATLAEWIWDREFNTLRIRLQIERENLYDQYDRLVSEGEFRCSIYFPIAILVVIAALEQSLWLALALVLPVALLFDGIRIHSQARELIVQTLSTGVIESPVVTRLQELSNLK